MSRRHQVGLQLNSKSSSKQWQIQGVLWVLQHTRVFEKEKKKTEERKKGGGGKGKRENGKKEEEKKKQKGKLGIGREQEYFDTFLQENCEKRE